MDGSYMEATTSRSYLKETHVIDRNLLVPGQDVV